MSLTCLRAGQLLSRRQSGLNTAEGLELEEHLAGCASCRAEANLLQGLTRLADEAPTTLSESARQRSILSALSVSPAPRAKHAASRTPQRAWLLTAAAAALVCGWFATRGQHSEAPAPVASTATDHVPEAHAAVGGDISAADPQPASAIELAAAADRVLSGRVEAASASFVAGERLPEHTLLHTTAGAAISLAHAHVELRADAHASWDGQARRLSLPRGSALIEVDPARHQSFEVETSTFMVAVLGTRFEVSQSSVVVLRGRVSVQPKASQPEAAPLLLTAGSKHSRFELPPSAAQLSVAKPERGHERPPHAAHGSSDSAAPHPPRSQTAARQSASMWLDRARALLAARQLQQARHTLELAKPILLDNGSRAQALSLEAECEQQAHRFGSARDKYLRVVQLFPRLPAAETALFAAARIEADHGQAARAKQLLAQYLASYPSGSFAREATLRLRQLENAAAEPTQ